MISIPKHKKLILFDGVCNLCNSSVQYVIKHDKKNTFLFTSLQSDMAQDIIKEFNMDTQIPDSIVLFTPDEGVQYKSTAVLKIAKSLGFPINLMPVFFIIPRLIRDSVYDYIAKNRYKWYGKKKVCMVPGAKLRHKFL